MIHFTYLLSFICILGNISNPEANLDDKYLVRGFPVSEDYVFLLSKTSNPESLSEVIVVQEATYSEIEPQEMQLTLNEEWFSLNSNKTCLILQTNHVERAMHGCTDTKYINGIGLSRHIIQQNLTVDEFLAGIDDDVFLALSGGSGITIDKCQICASGGPGASKCEYSGDVATVGVSCSVTCRDGYYACCHVSCYCCIEPNSYSPKNK